MAISNVILDTAVIIFILLAVIGEFIYAFNYEDPETSRVMRIFYRRYYLLLLNYFVPYILKIAYGLRWLCYGMKRQ